MQKVSALIFGICYILSFVCYSTGMGLLETVQQANTTPGTIIAAKSGIIWGGTLVVLVHSLLNLCALTAMLSVLQAFNRMLSYLYFQQASPAPSCSLQAAFCCCFRCR